ncbi:MAG: hypothetical protein O7E52_12355, partial [Candidatus Poribacteria bacterium]|nr:hypothetical protein [Candidatus Poribacteria bacterium]
RLLTPRHQPAATLDGHLTFALKYEGVDLAVLKCLFLTIGPEAIEQIRSAPSGKRGMLLNQPEADVVKFVCDQGQLPCLYFCHSRKRCEDLAFDYGEYGWISPHPEALSRYDVLCNERGIDQDKGAVLLRESIACGIGYHHAGLLPGLKDVIERMFALGFIQLIFTTETFALGLNLPVSSVIFDRLEKFDGARWRHLKSQEYHQMAGRAGRRGLDTCGHVYACVDPFKTDVTTVSKVMSRDFEQIDSRLDPCYATLLNLYGGLRVGNPQIDETGVAGHTQYGAEMDAWIKKSFRYFQSLQQLNQLDQQITGLEDEELLPVECIYDQPHLIEEYQQISDALAKEKTAQKKRQREFRRAKRAEKQEAAQALDELNRSVEQIEASRNALLCTNCPHRGECMRRSQKLRKAQRMTNRLAQRKAAIEHLTPNEVDRRLAFLESLEYIHDGQLTPKGRCAARLYGYEIQTTELLYDGYFDWLDEVQINILATAISFASRPDTTYQRFDPKRLDLDFAVLDRRMQRLAERQRAFGIERRFKMLDASLSSVVNAWSKGCEFSELEKYTDAAEGDIIRGLRRAINLLRQLEGVLPEDTKLHHKIGRCIGRMNRGIVDAESELSR